MKHLKKQLIAICFVGCILPVCGQGVTSSSLSAVDDEKASQQIGTTALHYTGYEMQNDMPLFYQAMKDELTYPMAWGNSPIKKFAKWRKEARKVLLQTMQPAPPIAGGYNYEQLATEQREGYRAEKIVFNVSDYSRVPAYLLVPDGDGPFPALLLLHDHGARFSIGKEKMVRPFQVDPSVMADANDWVERCYDNQFVGDYLASQGYVVLVLDALFWGERGRMEGVRYDSQQALAANMMQMGMSWGALIAWDDIRSAEFLAQLPCVDQERVGAMGFSMGAHRAWMSAAATDVVKATAAVCWMNTTEHLMTLTNNQNKGGSAYSMLIPGLRNQLDYPHVASIAAPKPMLLINGKRDKLFPVAGVDDSFKIMQEVWESQQAADNLTTTWYDLPHFCSKEIQAQVLDFFNQHIK
ncbi:MAG: dienelactone hydrolase family protein [Phocaeicola sp.]